MQEPGHTPVDTATAPRPRSILKKRDSHDCESLHSKCHIEDKTKEGHRGAQWDEMNILATYHPADKDYGHMKIDDPPTPYHEYVQELDEDMVENSQASGGPSVASHASLRERKASFSDTTPEVLDSDVLAEKLAGPYQPKMSTKTLISDDDDESTMTEEQRAKKKSFESKRKHHYNEFQVLVFFICFFLRYFCQVAAIARNIFFY